MATWVAAEAQRRLLGFHVWSSTPKNGGMFGGQETDDVMVGIPIHPIHHKVSCQFQDFRLGRVPQQAPVTTTCREYTTTTKNHYDHQTIPKATTTPKPEGSEEHGQKQSRWHVTPEQLLQYCYDISLLWVVQKTQHLVQHHMSSQGFIPRRHYQPGLWFCPRNRLRSNHSAAEKHQTPCEDGAPQRTVGPRLPSHEVINLFLRPIMHSLAPTNPEASKRCLWIHLFRHCLDWKICLFQINIST